MGHRYNSGVNGSVIAVGISAALASGVEFVEALTIVLAVGFTKSWRDALKGTAAATVALVCLVTLLGFGLLHLVSLDALRLVIGALLLVFGLKWLRKAILRFSGLKSLHDEDEAYRKEVERFRATGAGRGQRLAGSTQTGVRTGVFLFEGAEVVFIVVGLGAAGRAFGLRR